MSAEFECLVTIGHKKHSIYLDKDMDSVLFIDVYQQLMKVEPNISFDYFLFEVNIDLIQTIVSRLPSTDPLVTNQRPLNTRF